MFTEIFAWSEKSLAHSVSDITPSSGMTRAEGNYENLFNSSMNLRGNCVDFGHNPST